MSYGLVDDGQLIAIKEQNPLSCPQKCRISQKDFKLPATSLVILKSGETRVLCRLFYLNSSYDDKSVCYLDDSVQLGHEYREVRIVESLEVVDRSNVTEFNKVTVQILVNYDKYDQKTLHCKDNFIVVTQSILKEYSFTSNCSIACDKFGITKIVIIGVDPEGKYGTLAANCELEIDEIFVDAAPKWKNIALGGLNKERKKLEDIIQKNVAYLHKPEDFPNKPPCQVLISGPSGSGKSTLIHQVSNLYKCNLFEISGDIIKPYPGQTENELKETIKKIMYISCFTSHPTIILFENIEVFCPQIDMNYSNNSHLARLASMIYAYLDEITAQNIPGNRIIVVGTTSKMEEVNIALRRYKRFSEEIYLKMPNLEQRYEITKLIIHRIFENDKIIKQEEGVKCSNYVAQHSSGFVAADLDNLCQRVYHNYKVSRGRIFKLFQNELQSFVPSFMRTNLGIVVKSNKSFKDIGGMERIKKSLMTSVIGPLVHPAKFNEFGLNTVSGILLYGASGCAKTTLVKCLAGESKMNLLTVSSAEIYSPYVGEAEKFLVKLFNQARLSAPAILFFDEIDTIVGNRTLSNGTNDAHMRILSTLLTEIDGFGGSSKINTKNPVIIVGATNRPECIDNALMRPGRFDKLIHVPVPDFNYRLQILKFLLGKKPIEESVNVEELARRTENFSGADLENLCNEAALHAATRDLSSESIIWNDFENVFTFLRPSLTKEKIEFYEKFESHHSNITA